MAPFVGTWNGQENGCEFCAYWEIKSKLKASDLYEIRSWMFFVIIELVYCDIVQHIYGERICMCENVKRIETWLRECDAKRVKPWKYDFKEELLVDGEEQNRNNVVRIFEWYIETSKYHDGATEETKLAKAIYCQVWGVSEKAVKYKQVDMDVMNSFWTTYKQSLKLVYGKICNRTNEKSFKKLGMEIQNGKYHKVNERFVEFAGWTHTIGNFALEPKGFNKGRSRDDYWDYGLKLLQEWESILEARRWKETVDAYYLQPFVNESYEVLELWDGHYNVKSKMKPENIEQVNQFLRRVSLSIEERGKYIIKALCVILGKKNYKFYEELRDLKTPQFANELWAEEKVTE